MPEPYTGVDLATGAQSWSPSPSHPNPKAPEKPEIFQQKLRDAGLGYVVDYIQQQARRRPKTRK